MSRSALWRQDANVQERERKAEDTFQAAIEEGRSCRAKGLIALHGPDDTFNIHPVLLAGIRKSPYFQKCFELKDWTAIVDQIYYEVKHVEPWVIGPTKVPSTAFCLLFRLFTIRCTEKQMQLTLDHVDSPYIRCIGFLYLRYGADPKILWRWFEPYLFDEEKVRIEANKTKPETTIGAFARSLLTDMDFYGTLLPRLPMAVEKEIKNNLIESERSQARAQRHISSSKTMDYLLKVGSKVRALYGDEENPVTWYDAVIDRIISHDEETGEKLKLPKFCVTFPEYGNTEIVALGEVDLPSSSRISSGTDSHNGMDGDHSYGKCTSQDRSGGRSVERHSNESRRRNDYGRGRGYDNPRHRPRYATDRDDQGTSSRYHDRERRGYAHENPRGGRRGDQQVGQKRAPDDNYRRGDVARGAPKEENPKRNSQPKGPRDAAAVAEKKRKLMAKYG